MERANFVSIDEVTKLAEKAANEVLGARLAEIGGGPAIGMFPDIGTIGIIWRDPDWSRFEPQEMLDMSAKIVDIMGPAIGKVQPSVNIFKGGITAGYFPVEPMLLKQL